MIGSLNRLFGLLRSRRLAVWLLAGLLAYMSLASLIPMGAPTSAEYLRWASSHPFGSTLARLTGLNRPYLNPVLLAAEAFLSLATAMCAWERTAVAVRNFRRWKHPDASVDKRLNGSRLSVQVADQGVPATSQSDLPSEVARGLRLKLYSRRDGLFVASARPWAVFASPAFHWALVGIFVFAALGTLSRGEGGMRIVEGSSKADVSAAYMSGYRSGPLYPGGTSIKVAVPDIQDKVVVDGVDRGTSPLVRLSTRGRNVERLVFPNSVATLGRLSVHRQSVGVGVVLDFDFPNGQRLEFEHLFDPVEGLRLPAGKPLDIAIPGGTALKVMIAPIAGKKVRITPESGSPTTVNLGESVKLSNGISITPERSIRYAQLRLVDDWSLPWVYACFTIVCVASSIALLTPPRIVWMVQAANGELKAIVMANRSDAAFRLQVERKLAEFDQKAGPEC